MGVLCFSQKLRVIKVADRSVIPACGHYVGGGGVSAWMVIYQNTLCKTTSAFWADQEVEGLINTTSVGILDCNLSRIYRVKALVLHDSPNSDPRLCVKAGPRFALELKKTV